jgi:hypothetical protein
LSSLWKLILRHNFLTEFPINILIGSQISYLDLSFNNIDIKQSEFENFVNVVNQSNLKDLILQWNPFVNSMRDYRKLLIKGCPNLENLNEISTKYFHCVSNEILPNNFEYPIDLDEINGLFWWNFENQIFIEKLIKLI